MTYKTFTHANLKVPVHVTKEHVWNVYFSESHRSTFIVSTAGAIIPVTETVNQVLDTVFGTSTTVQTKEGQ